MALNALKIQTADLVGKLVAQLSNRPTNPLSAGGDNLTAQEVKERYDAYGHLLKERFNALVDALVADPAVDTDALANTIQVYLGDPAEEDPMSLSDALAALFATLATKYALPEGGIPATDLAEAVTTAINGKYVRPDTGIPATDLETAVQTSLGKADSAYQKPSGGIPADDLASAVKAILESAVSQSEFAPVKALAENADKVLTAANYEAVATMLNAAAKTDYKVGQKILIGAGRVPDLWIYFVHDAAVTYTYTTAYAFQTALENGTLQIGYYALRPLEAKTELEDYPTKTEMNSAISGNIDATLSTTGKSADAKAVGDAIDALIDGLVEGIITVAEAEYANASTYSQQAAHAEIADEANSLKTSLGVTDETPTAMQPVGGTSDVTTTYQKLNKLVGCKVVKNQLADYTDYNTGTSSGISGSIVGHKLVLSGVNTTGDIKYRSIMSAKYNLFVQGHKYLINPNQTSLQWYGNISGFYVNHTGAVIATLNAAPAPFDFMMVIPDGTDVTGITFDMQVVDLTLRYGNNDVVNAIIGNDSSKYVEKLLAFDQNILADTAYDTGSFSMCKSATLRTVDYNQWDEVAEVGYIDTSGIVETGNRVISKNYIDTLPNKEYAFVCGSGSIVRFYFYDASENFIRSSYQAASSGTFTTPMNARFMKFMCAEAYGTTYNHDICIFLYWDGSRIGYEPYSAHDYTLPNKDLNGILTVKNGKVVAVGDELYPSGEGNATRYAEVDLGTLNWDYLPTGSQFSPLFYVNLPLAKQAVDIPNAICTKYSVVKRWVGIFVDKTLTFDWTGSQVQVQVKDSAYTDAATFKAAMSGVKLIYELATPTSLTASTFPSTFYGDDFGTMWFLDEDGNVIDGLQGNEIFYKANVAGFAESLYSEAEGDPDHFEAAGDVPTDIANFLKGLTGYDASKTQTLKNVTGTLTWVDDV